MIEKWFLLDFIVEVKILSLLFCVWFCRKILIFFLDIVVVVVDEDDDDDDDCFVLGVL